MDDRAELSAFVRANPFATIVSLLDGELVATHVPVLLEGEAVPGGRIVGHFARANGHWRTFDGSRESLVIFAGPHAYVSPAWYNETPAVPTWNYAAVHVYGAVRAIEEPDAILPIMDKLIARFDTQGYTRESVPQDYRNNMAKGTVGFDLTISRVEGKAKLSQNRPVEDRRNVVHHLLQSPDATEVSLAEHMQTHLSRTQAR